MKELHYMSTLAVSGTVDGKETVDFSERSLNIGQVFLNAYERSKFECEFKVQDYFSHGGTGKIYRAGNVSGCSTDGRFQKNAIGNRFVGLLSAICDLGMVPDMTGETICLTPIDDVAHALFLLFQSPDHDRETFHVDNGAELDMRLFYEALDLHAGPLLFHSSADLKVLFDQFATHDSAQQMLGKLWAGRADRNVRFDHSSTTDKLRDLGFEYSLLDRVWVEKFILGLKRRNVLQKTSGQTTN
jgi:thioester reductase-like protein